jgi:chromate transporter
VAFGIGLQRAGWLGAVAAWGAFTLPSAILMTLAAFGMAALAGNLAQGLIHGLKLVAVAVIAQAVFGMARTLTPDAPRAAIALAAVVIVTFASATLGQVIAISTGLVAGLVLRRSQAPATRTGGVTISRRAGVAALAGFILLLVGGPVLAESSGWRLVGEFDAFYRSGALVFGGGHVVLPLLKEAIVTPGWVSEDAFLAGYGAAQALPGPLFTFGAYLGAMMDGVPGAILGLIAISVPGLLVLTGVLPFWASWRASPRVRAALAGANAAVVGILGAALYNPVWTSAVLKPADFAAAASGFVLLVALRAPPLVVVALGAAYGVASAIFA